MYSKRKYQFKGVILGFFFFIPFVMLRAESARNEQLERVLEFLRQVSDIEFAGTKEVQNSLRIIERIKPWGTEDIAQLKSVQSLLPEPLMISNASVKSNILESIKLLTGVITGLEEEVQKKEMEKQQARQEDERKLEEYMRKLKERESEHRRMQEKRAEQITREEMLDLSNEKAFAWIEGGKFKMGSNDGDPDEAPVHEVVVDGFYMLRTEVTRGQWKNLMGTYPDPEESTEVGDEAPVVNISWYEALEFCNRLSKAHGKEAVYDLSNEEKIKVNWEASGYRLPTEAEWEYAARGGSEGDYCFSGQKNERGEDLHLEDYGWFDQNSDGKPHDVGMKAPNKYGLHDMHGNVWEWCWDRYDKRYYKNRANDKNPFGPKEGSGRVMRGGGWGGDARGLRSADRGYVWSDGRADDVGFRPLRTKRIP
ncbi:MAG: SUMF1/EgtB/PvdO family nonheme iron enzyme [Deltaproteobacteria bacterium]|nr:SUMF1/EgtB/PvdO family nonheme iron enzyme [Deltaproteobacteria bacterium]